MFDELFADDLDAGQTINYAHFKARNCASKLDLPQLSRQESQLVGLKNQ